MAKVQFSILSDLGNENAGSFDRSAGLPIIQWRLNYRSKKQSEQNTWCGDLSATLKMLGDPTRLAIFDLLMQGVQCNCELGDELKLPMNLISHHLKVLRDAGLVEAERDAVDARWIYYSINRQALDRLRAQLSAFLDPARIQAAPSLLRSSNHPGRDRAFSPPLVFLCEYFNGG